MKQQTPGEFYEDYFAGYRAREPEQEKQRCRIQRLIRELRWSRSQDLSLFIGIGRGAELEAGRGTKVGFDLPFSHLPAARARYPQHLFTCGDGCRLPFQDGCFDYLVCSEVIEHIEDRARCLQEIARVLKPDGVLILSTPNWWSWYGVFRFLYERVSGKEYRAADQPLDAWTTPPDLMGELSAAFVVVRVRGSWYWPPTGKGDAQLLPGLMGKLFCLLRPLDSVLGLLVSRFGHSLWVAARPRTGLSTPETAAFQSPWLRLVLYAWLGGFCGYAMFRSGILSMAGHYLQLLFR